MIPRIVDKGLRLCGYESFTESGEPPTEIDRVDLKVVLAGLVVFDGEMGLAPEESLWKQKVGLHSPGSCTMTAVAYDKQGNASDPSTVGGNILNSQPKPNCKITSPKDGFELPTGEYEIIVEASVTQKQRRAKKK